MARSGVYVFSGLSLAVLVALLSLSGPPGRARAEALPVVAPTEQPAYVILEASARPSPDDVHPVFKRADATSPSSEQAARLLQQSYARQALVLHRYARNYQANRLGVAPALAAEPAYLFLGGSGGYAGRGFWLEDGANLVDKRNASYVGGLAVGAGYFGDFEQLFPHELGHVTVQELAGWQQGTLASQVHQVTMVTDYVYAFNEGWAEHFQTVAVDETTNAALQAAREEPVATGRERPYKRLARELDACFLCPATVTLPLWLSQRESSLRYAGVKNNLFQRQPTVPEDLLRQEDARAALLYQAVVPAGASDPIRNGPQMLANEGLIATLFYRLVNDSRLQQSYREPTFYEPFLPPDAAVDWSQQTPADVVTAGENVYLKLFAVFAQNVRLNTEKPTTSPVIQLVKGYAAAYPEEAAALYDVFLDVTAGVTVDTNALQLARARAVGDLSAAEHEAYLRSLHRRLLAGDVAVDAALAPSLWLRNTDVRVGAGVFDVYGNLPRPYHFNLNAATVADLRTVPGVDLPLARQIIITREARGGFQALTDVAEVPGVTADILARLEGMAQSMDAWRRQGVTDPEEDALTLRRLIWSLLVRAAGQWALLAVVAGLLFAVARRLQAQSVKRLNLARTPSAAPSVPTRWRHLLTFCLLLLLPLTLFYLLQLLLLVLNSEQRLPWLAFALGVWFLSLVLHLGGRLRQRDFPSLGIVHEAFWRLLTYAIVFGMAAWLMGA